MCVVPFGSRLPPLTIAVGGVVLTAFFDGILKSAYDAYHHISPGEIRHALGRAATEEAPFTDSNCFLAETGNGLTLIDAGSGNHLDDTAGMLSGHLTDLGIRPDDIDFVVMTHLHADHVGGLVDTAGKRLFPRAHMLLHAKEASYWSNAAPGAAGEHHPADLSGMTLRAYAADMVTFEDGEVILPGIRACFLPGHTPGHTGYLIGNEEDRLLVWGDAVHLAEVQFSRPEITTIYDHDVTQAEASRRQVMAMAADQGLLVAGMHLRQPPFGRVQRNGTSFSLQPIDPKSLSKATQGRNSQG